MGTSPTPIVMGHNLLSEVYETRELEDALSLVYLNHHYAIWHFIRHKMIAEAVNVLKGDLVLDVGCGIGLIDSLITNKTVVGVDISPGSLREARWIEQITKPRVDNRNSFVLADVMYLPFRRGFDIVLSSEMLEHLSNDVKPLRAMSELLEDSGALLITVPNWQRFDVLRLISLGRKKQFMSLATSENTG